MQKGIKLKFHECQRCHYRWIARSEIPAYCPKCHTAKWNIPRTKDEKGRKPKE
jgi:predicted Zn-ribbon and HTH transcriptional regulator